MPVIQQMSVSDQKSPPLTPIDNNIIFKEHMPAKNHKSPKRPTYETEEEWISYPNYRKDVD